MILLSVYASLLACSEEAGDSAAPPRPVDWSAQQIRLTETVRDRAYKRAILHLHSPYSHDACDGDGIIDGAINEPCLDDLRYGLCASAIDLAFVTDHPSHAAEYEFEDWLLVREGDQPVTEGGAAVANRVSCAGLDRPTDGGEILWMAGIEDELMPVGMDAHVPGDAEERDQLYNRDDGDTIGAMRDAGGVVLLAHTEGRDLEQMVEQQAAGLTGFEMFNLHAMFAPDIREDDLGLDGIEWIADTAPFLDEDNEELVPDLAFLAVYQQQDVSVEKWDALNATGSAVGVAGSDAHQNVLPTPASDGERFDSYRRMTRWFSNWLMLDGDPARPTPADARAALEAGRVYTVFEALGTPAGLDVHLDAGDTLYEIGSDAAAGTLVAECPALHPDSPTNAAEPEIGAVVYKDGAVFAEGCGRHEVSAPGVYRVVFTITPHHLEDFLADETHLVREYPWIYSNPFRLR